MTETARGRTRTRRSGRSIANPLTSIIWPKRLPAVDSKRRLLIVDNASWHKAQRLNWHHLEVHYLPGYSPDFNPIERLWLRLKADFFSDFIAKSPEELTLRLCHALTSFMNDPEKVASQCAFRK